MANPTIKGLDKFKDQIEALKEVHGNKALLAGAYTLQKYSMENAPVKTGFLRASHESIETDEGAEMRVNANYAFFVEYGTEKMPAKPFVRLAIDSNEKEILEAIADEIQKEMKGNK